MTDDDFRAAEYVLGTLSAEERETFVRDMRQSSALRDLVAFWESRLASLDSATPPVVPPESLWRNIRSALDARDASAQDLELARLRRSRSRWRQASIGISALAACLLVIIGLDRLVTLRGAEPSYIAFVDRGGDLPALIIKVDTRAGAVLVQPVSAEFPPDRSLELWYIAEGRAPQSVGVMDDSARSLTLPAVARSADLTGSTLAVSIEPRGGSKTGAPTGPVVYSGRLIREK